MTSPAAARHRPLLMMPKPMAARVSSDLADRIEIVRLWEQADTDEILRRDGPRVTAVAVGGHAVVDGPLMDRLPNLEIVANYGVGYDSIDATEAARRGIVVTNTPGVLDDDVADTAVALLLMTVRQLSAAERYLRSGGWLGAAFPLAPTTLAGRTVGILGLGRVGEAIARRLEPFGVDIVYHNRRPKEGTPYPYYPSVAAMARAVDTLVVSVPGGSSTRHAVDEEVLSALGDRGILVNVARGSVVDETALIAALRNGTILGAGLDVFADEPRVPRALMDMDHVVLLPHVGSATQPTRDRMSRLVVDNLVSWLERGIALTPVPETRGIRRAQVDQG